jgi:hypothetical protein
MNSDNTVATVNMMSYHYYGNYSRFENLFIDSFVYSNERVLPKTRIVAGLNYSIILIQDSIIRYVSTVEDLQAMENGYIYYLTNDIDMTGIPFEPLKEFSGVFDGQGYTISNLSLIKTYEDVSPYIGLFSSIRSSVVKNLNINGINYIVTIKSAVNNGLESRSGGLAGLVTDYSIIDNIKVSGDIIINNQTTYSSYTGGIIGYSHSSELINLIALVNVEFSGIYTDSPTGGIVGRLDYSSLNIAHSEGSVTGKDRVGGIVGDSYYSDISNVYTRDMTIFGLRFVGGVVGYFYKSNLSNSYAIAIFTNTNYYQGGIVGQFAEYPTISNTYSYTTYNGDLYKSISSSSSICNIDNVYSPISDGFSQTATLEAMQLAMIDVWDLNIWDFVNTDSDGNPTLK